jgi:hypothetical protein
MMGLEIRPEINLEVTVRRKSGGRKVYTFLGDPQTRWYRLWLAALLTGPKPPSAPTITDIFGASWDPWSPRYSPQYRCLFCDILAGKDSRSPSATDSKIYTPAKYTSDSYVKVLTGGSDIYEEMDSSKSTYRYITFGLSKSITMKEDTRLKEFGLVGRGADSSGNDVYFLVARDVGDIPVSNGDVVTLKYTVTLPRQPLGAQSGFTSWFLRSLAAAMTGAGYSCPMRPLTDQNGNYLASPPITTIAWSRPTLYDPGNISGMSGNFNPGYTAVPVSVYGARLYRSATGASYDDQSLGTEITGLSTTTGVSFSEAADYSQLTLSYWEYKKNPTSSSYTVYEYVFFGQCADVNGNSRYYILHKGTITGVGLGPNETVKAKIDFVLG